MSTPEKDSRETDTHSGVATTGHDWDGIKELDNPLPRWWLWTFYATIVWSLGYVIAYPAIPLLTDSTKGLLGYSSRAEVAKEIAMADAGRAGILAQIAETPVAEILKDPALFQFSVSAGRSAFKVHCSQCHGSGASGAPGYPNLNDDDWLWSGSGDEIAATIRHGVRFAGDDDSRYSEMPAFGRDELLDKEQIALVAAHVRGMAGLEHDAAQAKAGQALFAENCASCHGPGGEGIRENGGPRLTDPIWLYADGLDDIKAQIREPKHGVMPAWGARLGETTVKQLAVYVHSLGGGE